MTKYSLLSENEPTDSELRDLMKDVIISVKQKASVADKKLHDSLINESMRVKEMYADKLCRF